MGTIAAATLRTTALALTTRAPAAIATIRIATAKVAVRVGVGVSITATTSAPGTGATAITAASGIVAGTATTAAASVGTSMATAASMGASVTTTAVATVTGKPGACGWQFLAGSDAALLFMAVTALWTFGSVDVAVHFAIGIAATTALLLAARWFFANAIERSQFARFIVIAAAPR